VAKKDKDQDALETVDAVPETGAPVDPGTPPPETATVALERITQNLPAPVAERVQSLLAMMDPNKPGFEEMGGAHWSPPIIKVHQPVSSETPANSKNGDLYTDTGDVLERPWTFIPIYMHYSHARFEEGNASPTCRSEDAKTSIYGDACADCEDFPFRDGQRTNCQKSLNVFVFDAEFGNVYKVQFAKTSYRAGSKLFKQARSTPMPWSRTYVLTTQEKSRQEGSGKYFVLNVAATGENVNPQYFPMIEYIYQQLSAVRKKILSNISERSDTGKKVVDNLPKDFGAPSGGGSGASDKEPDFSDL
jgi:hypothetical protein